MGRRKTNSLRGPRRTNLLDVSNNNGISFLEKYPRLREEQSKQRNKSFRVGVDDQQTKRTATVRSKLTRPAALFINQSTNLQISLGRLIAFSDGDSSSKNDERGIVRIGPGRRTSISSELPKQVGSVVRERAKEQETVQKAEMGKKGKRRSGTHRSPLQLK